MVVWPFFARPPRDVAQSHTSRRAVCLDGGPVQQRVASPDRRLVPGPDRHRFGWNFPRAHVGQAADPTGISSTPDPISRTGRYPVFRYQGGRGGNRSRRSACRSSGDNPGPAEGCGQSEDSDPGVRLAGGRKRYSRLSRLRRAVRRNPAGILACSDLARCHRTRPNHRRGRAGMQPAPASREVPDRTDQSSRSDGHSAGATRRDDARHRASARWPRQEPSLADRERCRSGRVAHSVVQLPPSRREADRSG